MMVGLLEKEPGVPPRQSKRYGVRIVEPILDAMGITYHEIEEEADVGKVGPAIEEAYAQIASGRAVDRAAAVMMKRDDCLKALARHVTDADIVLPVYSTAFDWIEIRPHPLNYLSHGAMGLASSHALGLALGRPDRRVIVLDGDGSLLMNLGSLVTIARGRAAQPVPLRVRERHLRGQWRSPDPGPRPGGIRRLCARRRIPRSCTNFPI